MTGAAGAAALLLVLIATPAGGTARQVMDLGQVPGDEYRDGGPEIGPEAWVRLGEQTCFAADDGVSGRELWCSRGTPETTRLVRDIFPGRGGSEPSSLTLFRERLYFGAFDPVGGCGLWRTDGTTAGTERVAVIGEMASCELSTRLLGRIPDNLAALDALLLFAASDAAHGRELWRTDGTAAGTRLVADLHVSSVPGVDQGGAPHYITSIGGVALLRAYHPDDAREQLLWRSDGTAEGTFVLDSTLSPLPTNAAGTAFTRLGSLGLFAALRGDALELWRSDGTAEGTFAIATLINYREPRLAVWNDRAYFFSSEGSEAPRAGLWSTDGSRQGTRPVVLDLLERRTPGVLRGPGEIEPALGQFFFTLGNASHLWASDGTAAGTRELLDAATEPIVAVGVSAFADGVAFATSDSVGGCALAFSDGASELRTLSIGLTGCPDLHFETPRPLALVADETRLVYRTDDGVHGLEPWVTDGTPEGTQLLRNVNAASLRNSDGLIMDGLLGLEPALLVGSLAVDIGDLTVRELAAGAQARIRFGDGALLTRQVDRNTELLRTDGTPPGTMPVATIDDGFVLDFLPSPDGGFVYMSVTRYSSGRELWRSDGTAAGTVRLARFAGVVHPLIAVGNQVFFPAFTTEHGSELWRSDGTAAGTAMVLDLAPGPDNGVREVLGADGEAVYFRVAGADPFGTELWRSDGTSQGTRPISAPVSPGTRGYWTHVVGAGATTFALRRALGMQSVECWYTLYAIDGHLARATPLAEMPFARCPLDGKRLVAAGEQVFLIGADPSAGAELWRSDGTVAGTRRVRDIHPGPADSLALDAVPEQSGTAARLFAVGTRVVFLADDGTPGGVQVWGSDGTAAGTQPLTDFPLRPTTRFYGRHGAFLPLGDRLVFFGFELSTGYEPWITDGTPAGTWQLADIAPGPLSSYAGDWRTPYFDDSVGPPGNYAAIAGEHLFLVADDNRTGSELWRVALAPPGCAGDCDGDGAVAIDELVRGVGIALGVQALGTCVALDVERDGALRVNELIAAVGASLDGCGE